MRPSSDGTDITARLKTITGHLHAVDRLLRSGRYLDAVIQLDAVRAALGKVADRTCRHHATHCLAREPVPDAAADLLAVLRLMAGVKPRRART
jgi:DNA-binding FrmR family transcriptional regulator